MCTAVVSGIVTGARPVSNWPFFSLVPCNTPRSPCENLLFPVFFSFLKGRILKGNFVTVGVGFARYSITLAWVKKLPLNDKIKHSFMTEKHVVWARLFRFVNNRQQCWICTTIPGRNLHCLFWGCKGISSAVLYIYIIRMFWGTPSLCFWTFQHLA